MKVMRFIFMCHPLHKTFQFVSNICRQVVCLPFPFVFCLWVLGIKFFRTITIEVIEVIKCVELFVLHPLTQLIKLIWVIYPQNCLEDVLKLQVKFLLGFEEGAGEGSTHWCFGNVGRGAHVEVVKGVI